ncbi:hypothetical protein BV20DRAFT_723823 [Pilatotrama ljubarskyi]|nr:hypothetical protein BV20DRAFT_723823 [Pilatotrama ljubarskyi]
MREVCGRHTAPTKQIYDTSLPSQPCAHWTTGFYASSSGIMRAKSEYRAQVGYFCVRWIARHRRPPKHAHQAETFDGRGAIQSFEAHEHVSLGCRSGVTSHSRLKNSVGCSSQLSGLVVLLNVPVSGPIKHVYTKAGSRDVPYYKTLPLLSKEGRSNSNRSSAVNMGRHLIAGPSKDH